MFETQRRVTGGSSNEEVIELIPLQRPTRVANIRTYQLVPDFQVSGSHVLLGAAAVLVGLLIGYLLFGGRPQLQPEAPFVTTNGTDAISVKALPREEASIVEVNTWRGYEAYQRVLARLATPAASHPQQLQIAAKGPYGYAQLSAHRLTRSSFASVGFGARHLRDVMQVTSCSWLGADNVTRGGSTKVTYADVHWDRMYDIIIIKREGLRLSCLPCVLCCAWRVVWPCVFVSQTPIKGRASREEEETLHTVDPPPSEMLPHRLTVCTPPVRRPLEARAVIEFIEYHRHLGATRVVLYDAGAFDANLAALLDAHLAAGTLQVVPFREVPKYDMHGDGFYLALHDCMYRARLTSKWVAAAAWDEYLWVKPPETLLSLLARHEGRPWLTHGEFVWSSHKCRPGPPLFGTPMWLPGPTSGGPLAIERLVFRWPFPVCHSRGDDGDGSLCLDDDGARKYIADPRQVEVLHSHKVAVPASGGVDLSVDDMHHQLYSGIHYATNFSSMCSEIIKDDEPIVWWSRDTSQAEYLRSLMRTPYPLPRR
eukprot:jgi/Mesen1/1095/ME000123S00267